MSYKVFLVEDEIVAREGIRDNVDWAAGGFTFCGEAPDGEIALPLIQEIRPDVLITDIKMPFMDGLQLSKIVREHMPWVKIIVLSGHDEFEYAQAALKIGVTDYLLKPISSGDILDVLKKAALQLDQEKNEREDLKQLKSQAESNMQLRREQFLLRLVMGGISSGVAIEQGQQFGLNLVAQQFMVLIISIELCDESQSFDYSVYQHLERIISNLAGNNRDILWTKKDIEELVLILKGDDEEQLKQEGIFWAELIRSEGASDPVCRLIIETGSPQQRLSDIHRSFTEAMVKIKNRGRPSHLSEFRENNEHIELVKIDHEALESYLKFGDLDSFDNFYEINLRQICESALQSDLVMHYVFLEIILTIAQFVSDLDFTDSQVVPEIREIEAILQRVNTLQQIKAELQSIISSALIFRDNQANHLRSMLIQQAKAYTDEHYSEAELQMNQVAKRFNLSPSHFSTVFKHEIGESFRDYLNNLRIDHAKELLRTTNLKVAEVAYRSGYHDSHHFSTFFKKKTGISPHQFRARPQDSKN